MTECIVVIGAMGNIGRAISHGLLESKKKVYLCDLNQSIHNFGNQLGQDLDTTLVGTYQLDMTKEDSLLNLISKIEMGGERIIGVINLAYPKSGEWGLPLKDVTFDIFCNNVNTHLGGYFLVMKIFSDYFSSNGGGCIINLSSIYGMIAPKFEIYQGEKFDMPVEYAAIKSAIIQLGKYFSQKYKKNNVRINTISPGGVYASQSESFIGLYCRHTSGRGLLDPGEIYPAVAFLLDERNRSMTGQNICIDDGFSL